jgi:hypothetical protein
MATFTIETRDGDVDFICPDAGGYVRVYGRWWDGRQPCAGGTFRGSTLRADAGTLAQVARSWWRNFQR